MRAALVVLVLAPAVAAARPLPPGLEVRLIDGGVVATRDGATVPVLDDLLPTTTLTGATLSADGAALVIDHAWCEPDPAHEEQGGWRSDSGVSKVAMASLDARLDAALGRRFARQHRTADALASFARAAQRDPDTAAYATDLAVAQLRAHRLAEAEQTLATYAPRNRPWWVWRLQVDPALAPLRGPAAARLGKPPAGDAHTPLRDQIALSPLGLVASEVPWQSSFGVGAVYAHRLEIVEIASGRRLLRLPIETECAERLAAPDGGGPPTSSFDRACIRREAAAAAVNRRVADAVLGELGFQVVPKAYVEIRGVTVPTELLAGDGRKVVLREDAKLHRDAIVVDRDGERPLPITFDGFTEGVGFVAGGLAVIRSVEGGPLNCTTSAAALWSELTALPTR